jgi:hypothetical protein
MFIPSQKPKDQPVREGLQFFGNNQQPTLQYGLLQRQRQIDKALGSLLVYAFILEKTAKKPNLPQID